MWQNERYLDRCPCFPDGSWEYNLNNDIDAANCVLLSDVPFSMINIECYDHMQISLAELQDRLSQCGKVGNYLFEQLIEGNYRNCANNSWQATRTQWQWVKVGVSLMYLPLRLHLIRCTTIMNGSLRLSTQRIAIFSRKDWRVPYVSTTQSIRAMRIMICLRNSRLSMEIKTDYGRIVRKTTHQRSF